MQFFAEYALEHGSDARFEQLKTEHLAFRMAMQSLKMAMQIFSDNGALVSSVIILEASDQAEAEAICARDPFVGAGVYRTLAIRPCQVRFCDLPMGPA